MRTTPKLVAALSVVALLGVGLAAAQDASPPTDPSASAGDPGSGAPAHQGWLAKLRAHLRFLHRHPAQAIDKVCDGNMTVDECHAAIQGKVEELRAQAQAKAQKAYEQCLARKPKDYCDGRLDQFKADHPRLYGNATAAP